MSKLLDQQFIFTLNIARLIIWIYGQGYTATLGEGYDDDGVGHIPKSTHYIRLGQDINIFKDGVWLNKGTELIWKRVGEAWKALHPLNRWGGEFNDANHFSMEYQGRK